MTDRRNFSKKSVQSNWMTVGTIGLLFFIFGFVTWLNGILIPYLKISCELNHFESYLVAFSFYVAYVIMAIPSSWLLKKTGLKKGMMFGLFVMAGGALFFIPAAITRTYSLFSYWSVHHGNRTGHSSDCIESLYYNAGSHQERCPENKHNGNMQ